MPALRTLFFPVIGLAGYTAIAILKETFMSKKIVLGAAGANTATVTDAVISDIFTTVLSTDTVVSGAYGLAQRGAFFVAGMAAQNARLGRGWNPISAS